MEIGLRQLLVGWERLPAEHFQLLGMSAQKRLKESRRRWR